MVWVAIGLSFVLLLVVIYSVYDNKRTWREMRRAGKEKQDTAMLMMQQQIDSTAKALNQTIANMSQQVGARIDHATNVVGSLKEGLVKLEEGAKRILEVGKDVRELQDIFKTPKLRGGFGEFLLGDLLGQILMPENFGLQHRFKSGERVDAVVKLGESLVPIDAKFPLENFKRITTAENDQERKRHKKEFVNDVKKHVDAIQQKYILPDEGTFDFALMYIPAENVYYETIIKDEQLGEDKSLNSYALSKKVIPVSPNSLYAYLQAIVLGLKGMRVEESAKVIMQNLGRLSKELERFADDFEKIGTHITHAGKSFDNADRRLGKFAVRLDTITSIEDKSETGRQLAHGEKSD